MIRSLAIAALFSLFAGSGWAQSVSECDNAAISARFIAEPWESNTVTYANGATRVAILDRGEPGAAAYHILVLSPPEGPEMEGRQCRVISHEGGMGFFYATVNGMRASYDPVVGLRFSVPVQIFVTEGNIIDRRLSFTLNMATGAIAAGLE